MPTAGVLKVSDIKPTLGSATSAGSNSTYKRCSRRRVRGGWSRRSEDCLPCRANWRSRPIQASGVVYGTPPPSRCHRRGAYPPEGCGASGVMSGGWFRTTLPWARLLRWGCHGRHTATRHIRRGRVRRSLPRPHAPDQVCSAVDDRCHRGADPPEACTATGVIVQLMVIKPTPRQRYETVCGRPVVVVNATA